MKTAKELNDAINMILRLCCEEYNIKSLHVNISLVDDMWEAYKELRPDIAEKQAEMADFQRNCSASTVPPKELDGCFTIILQKEYVLRNFNKNTNSNWISTLVHEVMHIKDMLQFVNMGGAADYDSALDVNCNMMFYLWTEFNAKSLGEFFAEKYTLIPAQEDRLAYIVERELPESIDYFSGKYRSADDGLQQMYYSVHLLGTLYAWKKLFPEHFTDELIKKMFNKNIWMYNLFVFFSTHDRLDIAMLDFKEMKDILKQNFQGID